MVVTAIVEVVVVLTWILTLVVLAMIPLLITTLMLIKITTLWLSLSSAVRSLIHLRWRGTKTTLGLILHGMHQKSE